MRIFVHGHVPRAFCASQYKTWRLLRRIKYERMAINVIRNYS